MGSTDGRVAIVTGGGANPRGLTNGSATARVLARQGYAVGVVDVSGEAARATVDAIEAEGGVAGVYVADVTSAEDCERAVTGVVDAWGGLDALVNNVGVLVSLASVLETSEDGWERDLRLNVMSMALMTRHASPHLRSGGAIVNIASIGALRPTKLGGFYPVSKGAVISLTRTLAVQLGDRNIRVNSVSPGSVWTPMGARSRGDTDVEALERLRAQRREETLLKTEGTAWDTAHAVAFLAGDAARWITGQNLVVDGGTTLLPVS